MELAEQVLASFYEVRDVFVWVRSPAAFGGEGETRHAEGEDEQVRRSRNTYFVPIERMQKHAELFARLQSQRYTFMALFGAEAIAPFNSLREAQVRISVSAQTLIGMVGRRSARERNEALWDRCEADIWEGMNEANGQVDHINSTLANAIELVERICRPVLLQADRKATHKWFRTKFPRKPAKPAA
ncbi:MAG: hypothetical protein KGJ79_13450 [Alphaproteobacteria bacterium]|nr:hypothetical protein [Alphaproteobacteria bacterium]MDE2495774.1 hypothetical protein [Alphaproteobacteria bacterium]